MLTKKFKHQLTSAEIVFKQDEESVDKSEKFVSFTAGKFYPLIKIKDTLVDFGKIENFNLNIGSSLLPQLSCMLLDDDGIFQETNTVTSGDVITIFVGNAQDEINEPIKNDYYVLPNSSSTGYFNISGILHVPKLYNSYSRVFKEKTSIEIFELIAKECQLGFVTNIDSSNDRMNWIQYQTNQDFLHYLEEKSFVSNDTKIKIFIDQFANLNVIDIKKAVDSAPSTMVKTDLFTGEKLEKEVIFETTNWANNPDKKLAVYSNYSINVDYGDIARNYPAKLKVLNLNSSTLKETVFELESKHKSHLEKNSIYSNFSNDNAFDEYFQSSVRNFYNELLLKGKQLTLDFSTYIPVSHMYMTFQNNIYNFDKFTSIQNQDKNVGLNDEEGMEPNEPDPGDHINESLTGELIVLGMTINFVRPTQKQFNAVSQTLNCYLKKSFIKKAEPKPEKKVEPKPKPKKEEKPKEEKPVKQDEPKQTGKMAVYYTIDGNYLGGNDSSSEVYLCTQQEFNSAKENNNWLTVNKELSQLKEKGKGISNSTLITRAATIYGESSAYRVSMSNELLLEMTAIAFVHKINKTAYGANNAGAKAFKAKGAKLRNNSKMQYAIWAIIKSLTTSTDPSFGASMWDGIEQAGFDISDNRYSTGAWEIHMNTMGWTISNSLWNKWKTGVEALGGTFKAPREKYTPGKNPNNKWATAGTIALEARAVYNGTIFWKELNPRKKKA